MDYKRIVNQQSQIILEFEDAYKEMTEKSPDAETALSRLIDLAVTLRSLKGSYETVEESVRATIKEIMVDELQIDTHSTAAGEAIIVAASEYPDYDNKALETLVIADKELAERLMPFRKIRTRKESLRITPN